MMLGKGTKRRGRPGGGGVLLNSQESPSLAHRKERLQRVVITAGFVFLIATITEFPTLGDPTGRWDVDSEAVASRDVRADFAFESESLEATRERREAAAARVPNTYAIDSERIDNQLLTLQQRITTLKDRRPEVEEAVRLALLASTSDLAEDEVVGEAILNLATTWKEDPLFAGFPEAQYLVDWLQPDPATVPTRLFGEAPPVKEGEIPPARSVEGLSEAEADALAFRNLEPLTTLALQGLEYVLFSGVKQQGNIPAREGSDVAQQVIILRSDVVGDLKVSEERAAADVPDPVTARANLRAYIDERAKALQSEEASDTVDWASLQAGAFEMAKSGVTDTLRYDQVITEGNRELARQNVEQVLQRFDAGQILQEEGHRWTNQLRHDVTTYWGLSDIGDRRTRSVVSPIAANLVFVSLLLLALSRALPVVAVRKASAYKAMNVILLVTCGTLALGRVMSYFEPSGLVVPIAASAILITTLTDARVASLGTVLMTVLLSIQYGHDWHVLMVAAGMAFTGIVSLYRVRRRSDITTAAVKATLIGMLIVLASSLTSGTLVRWETVQLLAKVSVNGVLCIFIVPGLLSPLERLFGITTDIQLLEYSDLNNEILSRVAIEVPATYAHCLMMGQLAEAAADSIGANGLLSRVCAYYHDIGKLRRPEYFSENQTGQNVHEGISPRLSARAIASHVTEGVEIAREYHLPQPIIRGILEHHGTTLIGFFYQQALDQQKHGDVREDDYRYPGPKPQSPETAILMICDAVESGVRSIKNPNEERVREFIDKIIQARSEDRQFDECDLTLKKLDVIGDVLAHRIMTSLHTRIAYPDRPAEKEANNVIPLSGGRDS